MVVVVCVFRSFFASGVFFLSVVVSRCFHLFCFVEGTAVPTGKVRSMQFWLPLFVCFFLCLLSHFVFVFFSQLCLCFLCLLSLYLSVCLCFSLCVSLSPSIPLDSSSRARLCRTSPARPTWTIPVLRWRWKESRRHPEQGTTRTMAAACECKRR